MKPCFKNRKLIALLALGSLEGEAASVLRKHVESCDGCRRYLNELSTIAATLSAVESELAIEATASFHQRVVGRIKTRETGLEKLVGLLRALWPNWRVILPMTGGIAVLVVLLLSSRQQSDVPLPAPSRAQVTPRHHVDSALRPTVGNYHMVANQSLEKLDQLLTEQGGRKLPSAPVYTASIPYAQAE